MIRNLMLGMSLVTLSTVSAFAAPVATHHAKANVVAQAPAADAPAPSADKPVKKSTKKASKKVKGETKGEMAPAGDKAPATDAPKAK
jgi:hypothetical protein